MRLDEEASEVIDQEYSGPLKVKTQSRLAVLIIAGFVITILLLTAAMSIAIMTGAWDEAYLTILTGVGGIYGGVVGAVLGFYYAREAANP